MVMFFFFFSSNASLPVEDDWLADWRFNINSALSCRLCVMAFHINHPQWLLTPCRKSWPSGLSLELWGCILLFFPPENENEEGHTRKVKLGWFQWFFLLSAMHTHTNINNTPGSCLTSWHPFRKRHMTKSPCGIPQTLGNSDSKWPVFPSCHPTQQKIKSQPYRVKCRAQR